MLAEPSPAGRCWRSIVSVDLCAEVEPERDGRAPGSCGSVDRRDLFIQAIRLDQAEDGARRSSLATAEPGHPQLAEDDSVACRVDEILSFVATAPSTGDRPRPAIVARRSRSSSAKRRISRPPLAGRRSASASVRGTSSRPFPG